MVTSPPSLTAWPLDYLIGADGPQPGKANRITETPYGIGPAALGASIGYCNLRRRDGEPEEYGPYLAHDEVFERLGQGRPDPQGEGFSRNIVEQLDRCRRQGHTVVEQDHPDSYPLASALLGLDLAQARGLGVVAKNPGLLKADAPIYVAHSAVVGIIVEKDCGSPREMDELRRQAGKPALPVWFVSFRSGRSQATRAAKNIAASGFVNMGVTYSRKGQYTSSEDILAPIAAAPATEPTLNRPGSPSMATAPTPLETMTSVMGTKFSQSDQSSPTINGWLQFIGTTYPDMADYCNAETHVGYFSWCGATMAFCMAKAGLRPVYTRDVDTKSFLFALAWLDWGTPVTAPQPGDVLVFDFGHGDHHVTLLDHDNGDGTWACRGGNQSHEVNVTNFRANQCIGIRRPPAAGEVPLVPAADQSSRPELQKGAAGAAVSELQQLLGVSVNGQFGPDTETAVRNFQASHGLKVDGVVGSDTWGALLGKAPVTAATSTVAALDPTLVNQVVTLARNSSLAGVKWGNQGIAPVGYINGVAVTFARVYSKLKSGDSAALVMTAPIGGPATDALAWYGSAGGDRPAILRQLFTLLYGLGMAESSGNCFEGRDKSANNTTADTAEAGLFQQSWDSHTASPELPKLFAAYSANPDGFLSIFREGVSGSPTPNEGSGEGAAFQALCKSCPAFAAEAAAVGLRVLRGHWGTINRKVALVRSEADGLLQQVQGLVDAAAPAVAKAPTPADQTPLSLPLALNDILQRLKGLENAMNGTGAPGTPTSPQLDLTRIQQDVAQLGQMASTFAQVANQLGQVPTTGLPPQAAQIEQVVVQLGKVAATLAPVAAALSGPAGAAAAGALAPAQILSPIDKLLGGSALVGLKTPIAIFGYLVLWILQAVGAAGPATGDKASTTSSVLTALFGALGAAGVTAKFDRASQAIQTIVGVLQKPPTLPPAAPTAGG